MLQGYTQGGTLAFEIARAASSTPYHLRRRLDKLDAGIGEHSSILSSDNIDTPESVKWIEAFLARSRSENLHVGVNA